MKAQLTLDIRLLDSASFENYLIAQNDEAVGHLQGLIDKLKNNETFHLFYLWGPGGCGKTHLLQATCRLAKKNDLSLAYFSLSDTSELNPDALAGLETLDIVCLDDIEGVAGDIKWERALFTLCERMKNRGGALIIASEESITTLPIEMADLLSRLRAGLTYHLLPLRDADKHSALQLRAKNRGFELPKEVTDYLLKRYPRDTHVLFQILENIDRVSLAKKRRVTVPLIRDLETELQQ